MSNSTTKKSEAVEQQEKKDRQWAKSLLKGLDELKRKLRTDEKATAAYWNGDDWGSISGSRDADEWIDRHLVDYVLKRVETKP